MSSGGSDSGSGSASGSGSCSTGSCCSCLSSNGNACPGCHTETCLHIYVSHVGSTHIHVLLISRHSGSATEKMKRTAADGYDILRD